MSGGTVLILVVTGVLAVLCGWLVPLLFRSRRPFGMLGDVLVCTIVAVALAYVEWMWLLPVLGFGEGWISVAAAVGDPLGLGLFCLWIMRKVKA